MPERRSCLSEPAPAETGPLYDRRAWYVHLWTPSAGNALGIARGAIDSLTQIAATEASTLSTNLLRDRPMVQARIAEAEAIVNAARAFLFDAVGRLWAALCAGETPTDQMIAQGRLALVHAMHDRSGRSTKCFMRQDQRDLYAPAAGAGVSRCACRGAHAAGCRPIPSPPARHCWDCGRAIQVGDRSAFFRSG